MSGRYRKSTRRFAPALVDLDQRVNIEVWLQHFRDLCAKEDIGHENDADYSSRVARNSERINNMMKLMAKSMSGLTKQV